MLHRLARERSDFTCVPRIGDKDNNVKAKEDNTHIRGWIVGEYLSG